MISKSVWHRLPKPFSVLAPMEDVTDTVFRRIVMDYGRPNLFFTEFTSADGMFSQGREKVIPRLKYDKDEKPLIAQIWGNKPENYYKAAKEIAELGFDGLDINMGCPVSKVIGKGSCSALIDNPGLAKELIDAAKEGLAGKIALSVKTRLGFQKIQTEEWLGFLLKMNLDAITVHGRVAKQLSKYPANWDEISLAVKLKNQLAPDTIIVGNGDVLSFTEINQKHNDYGVDGVMIGRGIFHNLFVFNANGPENMDFLNKEQRLQMLKTHIEKHLAFWGPLSQFAALKKFFKIYIANFSGASDLRVAMLSAKSPEEALKLIESSM